jgi:hypothetical protein
MFDGVVKTLCDIRHVPEVEKNLISLGTLDSNGYGYKFVGGVMKVTKSTCNSLPIGVCFPSFREKKRKNHKNIPQQKPYI